MLAAAAALLIGGGALYLGRRDLTRPAVAFGVTWFAFVALAQLRLTEIERPWTTGFTLLVFGGGLAFMGAALVAGGTAAARGRVTARPDDYSARRLALAAVVLIAGGVAGAAYKANALDGIPLFSSQPDAVRSRALTGQVDLPSWSSALTDGFYIAMWSALAAIWALPRPRSRPAVAGLILLAALGLLGVCLDASRNLLLFALAVPAVALYLLARPRTRAARVASVAAGVGTVAIVVAALFVIRVSVADSATHDFLDRQLDRQPAVVKPLVPLYINGVYNLEAASRLYHMVPAVQPYGLGANNLTSLPARGFPEGKPRYGDTVSHGMDEGQAQGAWWWTVASYQGRLIVDLGWQGVLLGSLLLGIGFGALYRWARSGTGLLRIVVAAHVAYYSAYLIYDNHLSFSIIAVYDVAVIALALRYAAAGSRVRSRGRAPTLAPVA